MNFPSIYLHQGIHATNKLNEDFLAGIDRPKEIEIICPGEEPIVTIRDLVSDTANEYEGECVVVKMSGSNFNFRFSINCDEVDDRFDD